MPETFLVMHVGIANPITLSLAEYRSTREFIYLQVFRISWNVTNVCRCLNDKIKESLLFSPVLENEVKNIILLLKNSAAGWDGYDALIIKQIKDFIISPFTHICNLSITIGVFPQQMKIANIVPIYKSGDNTLFNNYRPVSVLPLFSKVLERIVYNRLIEFFNKHNVIYDYQFGFRKLYSTHICGL